MGAAMTPACVTVAWLVVLSVSVDARATGVDGSAPPSAANQPSGAPTRLAKIEVVADDSNRRPIPSFSVSVLRRDRPDNMPSVRLIDDPRGKGGFEEPEGRADIVITASGFHWAERRDVTISASSTTRIHVKLEPSNTLRVTVRDARSRRPIAGTQVDVAGLPPLLRALDGWPFTTTSGGLAIRSLPNRRFRIRVSADGYRPLIIGGIRGDSDSDQILDVRLTETIEVPPRPEVIGIGVFLGDPHDDGTMLVGAVLPDSAAAAALCADDRIVSVEGRPTRHMQLDDAVDALLGAEGTKAHLVVRRGNRTITLALERKRFLLPEDPTDGGVL